MYAAGVMPGDKIVEINGRNISFYKDITLYKTEIEEGETVHMTVKRNGDRLNFSFPISEMTGELVFEEDGYLQTTIVNDISETVKTEYPEGFVLTEDMIGTKYPLNQRLIGFSPKLEELGFVSLIKEAFNNTKFVVKLVYKSLWDLVSGKAGIEQVSGPVGIVDAVNTAVHSDYSVLSVLSLAALLTIHLGVFNLLPLPALDGGRLFFMIIEFIRRKPIPPEKEGMVHAIGLLLLLLLTAVISAKDIIMLINR